MAAIELDLPLDETPASRFLVWFAGGLTYLAVLFAAATIFAQGTLQRLQERPRLVTIALPAIEDPAEADRQLSALRALIESFPGVAWTAPVAQDEVARLFEPLVDRAQGEEGRLTRMLPHLLDIRLLPSAEPDLRELLRQIRLAFPNALADNTDPDLTTEEELTRRIRALGATATVLSFLLVIIGVAVLTRTSLDLHNETVDLLRLLGAPDRYVARQFERYAAFAALRGGSGGFALALLTVLGLLYGAPALGLSGIPIAPRPLDWVLLAAVPPAIALAVVVSARVAAVVGLRRLS